MWHIHIHYLRISQLLHFHEYYSGIVPNISNATSTSAFCDSNIFCGLPLYTSRMLKQA